MKGIQLRANECCIDTHSAEVYIFKDSFVTDGIDISQSDMDDMT